MKISLIFIACVALHEAKAATLPHYSKRSTLEESEADVKRTLDRNQFDMMITKREDEREEKTFPLPAMINNGAYQGDMLLNEEQWEVVEDLDNKEMAKKKRLSNLSQREPDAVNEREAKTFPLPAMINKGAYQGDMLLNEEQWEIVEDSENNAEVGKRKAVSNLALRWPYAEIRYYVEPDVEANLGPDIDASVAYYEQHTCLDFIKYTTSPSGGYIHIQNGTGCNSYVGFQNEKQVMNLNIEGCREAIPHEFGHAIGFQHEQTRPDRDSYVTVNWQNIVPGLESNFHIYHDMSTYGIPYDYKSYMHYAPTAFSVDNTKPTMVSKNPLDMIDMGRSTNPNFNDIKMVNLMYDCSSGCPPKTCNNEGYVDKNCYCVCPDGWTGSDCSTSVPVAEECRYTISGGSGEITSENYPGNYPNDYVCQWYFTGTSPGQTITVNFVDFTSAGYFWQGSCLYSDHLVIRQDDLFAGGDAYCGTTNPGTHVVNSENSPPALLVFFRTELDWDVRKRFKFTYSIE